MATEGLRVLMLGYYPVGGKVFGGTQAVVGALAPALAADPAIAQITVLSFFRDQSKPRIERLSDTLTVHYIRGQRRLSVLTRSFVEVAIARQMAKRLAPDIVHGHGMGWSGDVATQICRDAVVTVHGMIHVEARMAAGPGLRSRGKVFLIDHMARQVLGRASAVISISPYASAMLGDMVKGQLVHIANPIAAEFFAAAPGESQPKNMLFAGVMRPRKNVLGIINAFAHARASHPEATLTIVGPAPDQAYAQRVRDRVAELGLQQAVRMVGFVENAELIDELRACSALVMFSQEETLPTIIAQAQAIGRAVIASRVGGIADMIAHDETGFLVEPNDEQALASRMAELFASPQRSKAMGAAARQIAVARYAPAAIARQTVAVYEGVLARRRGSVLTK